MSLPLQGMRILAIEQYGAGPFSTQHLADLGAEVIKIENPHDGGDVGRAVGPHYFGPGDSHFYQAFNRNKKSVRLDLKQEAGREVLHKLVEHADAVFNNLRGDLPAKLGLTYDALKHIRKDIVCVHLSAYGREGERAAWPGYDYLMQAEAGYLSLTGEPDGPPSRFGLSMIDLMTGTTAALGLVSGVLGARASGIGRDIDTSLFDVAMHNLAYLATWYLNGGHVTGRAPRSGHPSLVPSQLYPTKDGWLFIMCNKEKFWPVLAKELGKPEWAQRPEYSSYKARLENRDQFNADIESVTLMDTTANWMKKFAGKV
ncbi:MAG: CaiB/BaiF CoA transferase family protein, partial [Betaproteobacteria bacterium]